MAQFSDFEKLDIRVGEILEAKEFKEAKKPAYIVTIDFGPEVGIKQSSAQLTECYTPQTLVGRQILAIVNFPVRQIANFHSEVLVLGTYSDQGVVLIQPEQVVSPGDKLG
ncbi:MAG: tRNA-binding protein [Sphaerochaetaceae bacterium]|jgi:tRNA-binding protein